MQGFGALLASSARALALREKLLKEDSLIAWPSSRLVGVCKNKDAQRLNAPLLRMVADFWCPQWKSPAMIPIDDIKDEVWGFGLLLYLVLFQQNIVNLKVQLWVLLVAP